MITKKTKRRLQVLSASFLFLMGTNCSNEELELDVYGSKEQQVVAAKSANSVELSYNSVTASTQQDANPISNIDDNGSDYLDTRWSGYGAAVTVDFDFGTVVTVDYVNIAFLKSDQRQARFDYYSSNDGATWTKVGGKTSSGTISGHEEFDLTNINAEYLRLVFKGNSSDGWSSINYWNSVLDVEIYGTPGDDSTTTVSNYISVPAKIEAEDYDEQSGIRTENTGDTGGGTNVGWIDAGDYLSYNINVPSSGTYAIDFRVASRSAGTNFDIYQGNTVVGSISDATANGWQSWNTVSTDVELASGDQTLKLVATQSGWNINWFEVKEGGDNQGEIEDPVSGGTASEILGDFWKITLPVDSSGNGSDFNVTTYDDRNNNAAEYYDLDAVTANSDLNDFFYVEDGWAIFKAFCGGATTENSQYPRSELRGLDNTGDDNYFSMNDHQEMEVTVKVLEVPVERPEVNMVQIHGPDDEPLRVEYNDGSTGSTQGLHLTVNESDDNYNDIMPYEIGQELKVWVKVENGHLWIELDNLSTGDHYETDYDVVDDTGYWKVGCYLQGSITYCDVKSSTSFCQNGGESDDYYTTGSVAVKDLTMIRDGQVYK